MARFEQMVQVAAAAEEGLSPVASVLTLLVMSAAVVAVGAFLCVSMWRNRES